MKINPIKLSENFIHLSKELGFVDVGVSRPEVDHKHLERLITSLKSRYNAEMKWLERNPEKRINAHFLLENAKSVICLIHQIPIGEIKNPSRAKFAMGEDYHKALKEKLQVLVSDILEKEHINIKTKICVDTSPIFEKAFAVSAGLGSIGKHTLLIHPKFGSNIVLGEIISDVDFISNKQAIKEDVCGKCTKCIDACPTKAITKPYVLDARRCISYLTIENRGKVPNEFKQICNNKYGCDICTNVCPFNKTK